MCFCFLVPLSLLLPLGVASMADAPAPTSSPSPFARDRAAAGATRAPPAQRAYPRRKSSALTYCLDLVPLGASGELLLAVRPAGNASTAANRARLNSNAGQAEYPRRLPIDHSSPPLQRHAPRCRVGGEQPCCSQQQAQQGLCWRRRL